MELRHFCSCQETSGTPNEVKYQVIIGLCSVFIPQRTNKRHFYSVNFIWAVRKWLEKCLYFQGCHFITSSLLLLSDNSFIFPHLLQDIFFCELSVVKASCICTKPCVAVGQLITGLVLSPGKCCPCVTLLRHHITAILQWFTA